MASYMALLGTPRELNIPYFAMGAIQSRENYATSLDLDGKQSKLAGHDCIVWANARKDRDKIALIETRNYIPPKTAFYAQWLRFHNKDAFLEFLQAFPHHSLDTRIAKIIEEREALLADVDRRVKRRDFDLSLVGDEHQRTNLARRYVEMSDKLRQVETEVRLLESAKVLRVKWQESYET
jgi:hypothetical protein